MEFHPPIKEREKDELIAIADGDKKNWHQKAISQTKVELKKEI